jgi:hypothetical protein
MATPPTLPEFIKRDRRNRKLVVWLTQGEHDRMSAVASANNVTVADLVRYALDTVCIAPPARVPTDATRAADEVERFNRRYR